jgi:hypothetical protein
MTKVVKMTTTPHTLTEKKTQKICLFRWFTKNKTSLQSSKQAHNERFSPYYPIIGGKSGDLLRRLSSRWLSPVRRLGAYNHLVLL